MFSVFLERKTPGSTHNSLNLLRQSTAERSRSIYSIVWLAWLRYSRVHARAHACVCVCGYDGVKCRCVETSSKRLEPVPA